MRNSPLRRAGWLLVVPLYLTAACGAVNAASQPEPTVPAPRIAVADPSTSQAATAATPPAATPINPQVVEKAAWKVEPNATVGALVLDLPAGGRPLELNADRQFRSASLVKLLIAIDALERGADTDDRRRLAHMLAVSDDDIASSYWVRGGRSDIVVRTRASIGGPRQVGRGSGHAERHRQDLPVHPRHVDR
jgi:D-alanyl-D-alanine carboxypeptidase